MKNLSLLILLLGIVSCSFAPLTSPKSGSSLGNGKWKIDAGASPALSLTVGTGLSDNLDAGVIVEQQMGYVVALWGKYSIINSGKDGASLGLYGGVFTAMGVVESSGYFAAPVLSYRKGWFEIYAVPKFNSVTWTANSVSSDDRSDSLFGTVDWDSEGLEYWQMTMGVNLWFSDSFGLNLSGQMYDFGDGTTSDKDIVPALEFMLRF